MSEICFFRNDLECVYDDEEEEEIEEIEEKEEKEQKGEKEESNDDDKEKIEKKVGIEDEKETKKEETDEMSVINEESYKSSSDDKPEQNNNEKNKEITNEIITSSLNSISQSNNNNISNIPKNSEISNKSENNINIKESNFNNKEYNSLLNNIINKDKITNSIIITENDIFINNILEQVVNYIISINKKICFITNDIKRGKQVEEYFSEKKELKILFLQKTKTNKNEYLNFRTQIDMNNLFIFNQNILYKLLTIGYIKISDFGIMIFDECHLCDGNHPYNLIMQEFYFYYINNYIKISLPNIIGFTKSHFKEKNNIKNKSKNKIGDFLKKMAENLDCQIIMDPQLVNDNKDKNEEIVEYIEVDNYLKERNKVEIINIILIKYFFEDMINLCIKDYIKFNGETEELIGDKKLEIKNRYLNLIKDKFFSENLEKYNNFETSERYLHFLSQNSILFKAFEDMQRYLINIIQNIDLEEIYQFFEKYIYFYEKNLENQKNEKYLKKIYSKMINIFKICSHAFKRLLDKKLVYETNRINKFMDILNKIYTKNENNKTLIFVPNRKIANILNNYLNRDKIDNKFKNKSKYIVGTNAKKEENILLILATRTTPLEIKERIKEYNEGKINILICTPPVLEYLDSIKCDTILLFDNISNTNNYFQKIKSKSIKCNSKLIILTNNQDKILNNEIKEEKNDDTLKNYFLEGEKIKESIDLREENYIKNKNNEKLNYYYISETEAKISLKNCMILFNEINNLYCSKGIKINVDKKTEKYDEQKYICNLWINCNDYNLEFISGLYNDKQSAENECFMKYLIYLHQKRIIGNNFQLLL